MSSFRSGGLDNLDEVVLDFQRFPQHQLLFHIATDAKADHLAVRPAQNLDMIDIGCQHHIFLEGQAHRHALFHVSLDDKAYEDESFSVLHRKRVSDVESSHMTFKPK